MRIKTIFIIVITILLTIIIMQNAEPVPFKVLFFETTTSKLLMMLVTAIAGFVIGYLVGRPKRTRFTKEFDHGYDEDEHREGTSRKDNHNTLSDEDRDYISE
jgi:uncharacterized integral membrane protein